MTPDNHDRLMRFMLDAQRKKTDLPLTPEPLPETAFVSCGKCGASLIVGVFQPFSTCPACGAKEVVVTFQSGWHISAPKPVHAWTAKDDALFNVAYAAWREEPCA